MTNKYTISITNQITLKISIVKPKNTFYLKNFEVFTLKRTVITRDIEIIPDAYLIAAVLTI